MENASKALIIAGAILLAILLITLGIIVYRQAAGVIDNNAMDEIAVSAFNSKFEQYEGNNVRGAQVNALVNTVIQNNLSNKDDASKQISMNFFYVNYWNGIINGISDEGTTIPFSSIGKAQTGKSYKVELFKDEKSGYINHIRLNSVP